MSIQETIHACFAETYDSLWEARVYKDSRLVEKVRSVPIYGVINGFWIDEQELFELGLKISVASLSLHLVLNYSFLCLR